MHLKFKKLKQMQNKNCMCELIDGFRELYILGSSVSSFLRGWVITFLLYNLKRKTSKFNLFNTFTFLIKTIRLLNRKVYSF